MYGILDQFFEDNRLGFRTKTNNVGFNTVEGMRVYPLSSDGGRATIAARVKTKDSSGKAIPDNIRSTNREKLVSDLYSNIVKTKEETGEYPLKTGDIIIPAYNSIGHAEYTLQIVEKLVEMLKELGIICKVVDCLSLENARESERDLTKKEGAHEKSIEIDDIIVNKELLLKNISNGSNIWIFDNVATKGKTYDVIVYTLRDEGIENKICPLLYTLSNYTKIYFDKDINAYLIDRLDPPDDNPKNYIVKKYKNKPRYFIDTEVPEEIYYKALKAHETNKAKSKDKDLDVSYLDDNIEENEKNEPTIPVVPNAYGPNLGRIPQSMTCIYNGTIFGLDSRVFKYGYTIDKNSHCLAYLDGTSEQDEQAAYNSFIKAKNEYLLDDVEPRANIYRSKRSEMILKKAIKDDIDNWMDEHFLKLKANTTNDKIFTIIKGSISDFGRLNGDIEDWCNNYIQSSIAAANTEIQGHRNKIENSVREFIDNASLEYLKSSYKTNILKDWAKDNTLDEYDDYILKTYGFSLYDMAAKYVEYRLKKLEPQDSYTKNSNIFELAYQKAQKQRDEENEKLRKNKAEKDLLQSNSEAWLRRNKNIIEVKLQNLIRDCFENKVFIDMSISDIRKELTKKIKDEVATMRDIPDIDYVLNSTRLNSIIEDRLSTELLLKLAGKNKPIKRVKYIVKKH